MKFRWPWSPKPQPRHARPQPQPLSDEEFEKLGQDPDLGRRLSEALDSDRIDDPELVRLLLSGPMYYNGETGELKRLDGEEK